MLKVGLKAPDFVLLDQDERKHKLKDYYGQWVLLYFYPRDNTPGCTKEACAFRDIFPNFKKIEIKVFGISADSITSHKKFAEKFNLNFSLLADEEKKVLKKYKVWTKKKMAGKTFFGIRRSSYLINPQGKIVKVYKTVKPAEHARQVLEDLQELMS